jgi:hypothetical protein
MISPGFILFVQLSKEGQTLSRLRLFRRACALMVLTTGLLVAPAIAQPSMAIVPAASRLVSVTECHPQRSYDRGVYGPAYYPFTPYYWTDPYGLRYRQLPVEPASGTLSIDYMNISTKVMKTIDFGLVARGELVAEVRDVGTFSPHAEIKHQFGLDPNVFPLRTALAQCVPLRIIFADGTTWKNAHLPKPHAHMHRGTNG